MAAKMAKTVTRAEYAAGMTRYPKKKRRGNSGCLVAGIVVLIVLLVVLGVGGFFGYKLYTSAKQVRAEGKWMLTQADPLKEAIKTGNEELLDSTVAALTEKAAWINAETHTKLWDLATNIPVYGEDIRTAQALGEIAETLTRDALVPMADSIGGLKLSSLLQDGSINVGLLQELSSTLSTTLPIIKQNVAAIQALPPAHLPQVKNILDKLQDPLGEYGPLLDKADEYLPLLPPMLGADGATRTYLVIAMSNAELRSSGGFPGATGTITVTDGSFHLGEFNSIVHEKGLSTEMLEGEEVYNYGIFEGFSQVTAMPNFNRTGALAADYWWQSSGQAVDGVVAIDPVALQTLLALTNSSFDVYDGTHIDGTNAAFEILHNVYARYGDDNDGHNAFFAEVAGQAFSSFFANLGDAEIGALFKNVTRLGKEGRFLFWMVNPEEQAMLSSFGFGGEYAHDPMKPVLGIYLNDETYSKIDWFLRADVTVGAPTINDDGTATYDVTFVLTNTISYDYAENAPRYISGVNAAKRDVSDMITTIFFSMPQDAVLESFSSDPERPYWDGWPEGIQVVKSISTDLGGSSSTYWIRVTVPAGAEPLEVHVTPLCQPEFLTITYEGR